MNTAKFPDMLSRALVRLYYFGKAKDPTWFYKVQAGSVRDAVAYKIKKQQPLIFKFMQ